MKRSVRSMILAGTLVMPFAAGAQERGAMVTVRLYNYAGVEEGILRGAHQKAARILDQAGAETRWIDCPVSPEEAGTELTCAKPLGDRELVLKLLPDTMTRKMGKRSGTFGFAVPASNSQWLGTAFVFAAEAERLAYHGTFPTSFETSHAVILAHLIAHEIGHLLLGPDSHARSGIMSFPWTKQVLNRLGTAHLGFTRQEVVRIQKRLDGTNDPARVDVIARSTPN